MSSPSLQIQFDPSSARFGASRSQKRLEDDRLLVGKGRYSDDLEFAGLAWLVVVRSPHAHADISALDLSGCRSAAGVIAAWSMADLRADGVAHIPFPPLFKRSEEHTSELQSRLHLVCRLLLEKKKKNTTHHAMKTSDTTALTSPPQVAL